MAKKKRTKFSATKAVKSAAREQVGMPSPTRVLPDTRTRQTRRSGKHPETLERLLREQGE